MINHIEIDGFKNLSELKLDLKPLTVITGRNSTGKSSILQAILRPQSESKAAPFYKKYLTSNFSAVRNKYTNAKKIEIRLETEKGKSTMEWTESDIVIGPLGNMPELEKSLFYLSANRTGAEDIASNAPDNVVSGPLGEFLFSTLELEKSRPVEPEIARYPESMTLQAQINYWLSYIMDIPLEITVDRILTDDVQVQYKSDGIPGILPSQLGAGVSYLAKILILCLRSKRNDVIMIENPEIHLYPLAQSRLAEFLAFIATSGRQLLIETHSNDLITKIRHEVYRDNIAPEDVTILYKNSVTEPFIQLDVDLNGHFTEKFPETFFDATLKELLEMD